MKMPAIIKAAALPQFSKSGRNLANCPFLQNESYLSHTDFILTSLHLL